jgi:Protein of unknown function (DUF3147)
MKVRADLSALRRTQWYEYAIRFVLGGVIAASTGMIAKKFGPEVGGLFLAFPAIFPATATLIESHEKQKKQRKGLNGTKRGRLAAGVDAAGAAMGAGGLLVFALIVWKLLPGRSGSMVLAAATTAWAVVAIFIWAAEEKLRQLQRKHVAAKSLQRLQTR